MTLITNELIFRTEMLVLKTVHFKSFSSEIIKIKFFYSISE